MAGTRDNRRASLARRVIPLARASTWARTGVSAPHSRGDNALVTSSNTWCGDAVEGDIRRDVVVGHDVLHVTGVLVNIVAVVLALRINPLGVVLVEFLLVIRREAASRIVGLRVSRGIIVPVLRRGSSQTPNGNQQGAGKNTAGKGLFPSHGVS